MRHGNSGKQSRNKKTRNERKRDWQRVACMSAALILLWMMLLTMMVKAWDHPAEQPVNGYDYIESIGGDPYEHLQD